MNPPIDRHSQTIQVNAAWRRQRKRRLLLIVYAFSAAVVFVVIKQVLAPANHYHHREIPPPFAKAGVNDGTERTVASTLAGTVSKASLSALAEVASLDPVTKNTTAGGATGRLFTGDKVRTFGKSRKVSFAAASSQIFSLDHADLVTSLARDKFPSFSCDQWVVTTTINEPTDSIQRVSELPQWCIVIVGDEQTPSEPYQTLVAQRKSGNVIYLPPSYQKQMADPFLDKMPFRSFARKNVGFLLAVQFGAKVIFDVDDDNLVTALEDGVTVPPPFMWKKNGDSETKDGNNAGLEGQLTVRFAKEPPSSLAFNPYPLMGATHNHSWPRGYPVNELQSNFADTATYAPEKWEVGDIMYSSIGVIQSVCNGDPDNDAIFRLTRWKATYFTFDRTPTAMNLLIPHNAYSPYNAQATTHLYSSFWGLYLPISVTGRVTDIWRSYITQRIMKDVGLHLVYSPPIVRHIRSSHNYLADFQAESDLYLKTTKLIPFLASWKSEDPSLSVRIYELYIALYEHDYIEVEDVEAVEGWLFALSRIGYEFPIPSPVQKEMEKYTVARAQPTINGQPYRSRPYFNVNQEGKTYAQMDKHNEQSWNEWNRTVDVERRPHHTVIKLILMTMDEWPLIRTWALFHGELMGFENLYVIDGSNDPRCISFLRYTRDILGMNVIFSKANLNELRDLISAIAVEIGASSDYIMKVDTDEFMQVYNPESKTLSTSRLPDYVRSLPYGTLNNHYHLGYVANSFSTRAICEGSRKELISIFDLPLSQVFPIGQLFKAVINSNTVYENKVSLGGHSHGVNHTLQLSNLGVLHFHSKCFQKEVENSRKACFSHGYLIPGASKEEDLAQAKKILQEKDLCYSQPNATWPKFQGPSWHKVFLAGKAIQCPEQAKKEFYAWSGKVPHKNKEFVNYALRAEEKYRVYGVDYFPSDKVNYHTVNTFPPGCNWTCYFDRYPDFLGKFPRIEEAAIRHYVKHGILEGRPCNCL